MPLISTFGTLNALGMGLSSNQYLQKSYVAVARSVTPFVTTYNWNKGFNSAFAGPALLPSTSGFGLSFTKSNNTLAISDGNSTWVAIYPWSSSGYGTKYTSPSIGGSGNGDALFQTAVIY